MTDVRTAQARLIVHRTSPDDIRQRQVNISVDGAHVSTLYYGDAVSMAMAPGAHTLKAHNTLVWKTVPFSIGDGDEVQVAIINHAARGFTWLMTILGVGPIMVDVKVGVASTVPAVDASVHTAKRRGRA